MRLYVIALLAMLCVCSCNDVVIENNNIAHREHIDSVMKCYRNNIDTLLYFSQCYTDSNDIIGMMSSYNTLGKVYREHAEFDKAIKYHKKALETAEMLADTIEIIICNNDIATNFRRIGLQDEAAAYHFAALALIDAYSDKKSYTTIKNRVKTLNGIGNIYLSLGNDDMADSVFRLSLEGEQQLESPLGQAINLANIGSIFERKGKIDSARVYFTSSLACNELAHSTLGKALCYIHLGNLAETEQNWDEAVRQYQEAFNLMEKSTDRWHWLEACTALIRAYIQMNNIDKARELLTRAYRTATDIHAIDHFALIHKLYYQIYLKENNYRKALEQYELSHAYSDSVEAAENVNNLISVRIKYERENNSRKISEINKTLTQEKHNKRLAIWIIIIVIVISAALSLVLWMAYKMRKKGEEALLKMERIRNNFFTNITHEFRTPLTIILGLTEQIQKIEHQEVNKEIYEKVDTISKHGHNLLELVNQLLDISKVNSEIEEPDWQTGNIIAQIRMVVENYKIYARQKFISLCFETEQLNVEADFVPSYLTKIISNLLSNALKFTPKNGTITLSVQTDNDKIYITITDTGIGINAEDKKHIFDLFYQVDNEYSKQGSGIGLPLVKQLVTKLGGTIKVEDAERQGTKFVIELNIRQGKVGLKRWIPDLTEISQGPTINKEDIHDSILITAQNANDSEEQQMPLILVVDDNTDIAHYIGDTLKSKYLIALAENGAEALIKAQELLPDLIITDIMMPEVDGYELCQTVRSSNVLNHIPIIVITAKSSDADKIKCIENGADAYIEKPFNTEELLVRVSSLLSQRKKLRDKYSVAMYCDKEHADGMASGDTEFINKMTDIIYAQLSNHEFTIEQLAQRMCMSSSQLSRKVKTITGYSPATFSMQIRIEKSKRELALTDKPIGEIADICGFSDSSHFTRIFKQFTTMTPSQFRKSPK